MIIIPARLGSTRFPGKVLAEIGGFPLVVATANRVCGIDDVVIATDAEEVAQVVKDHGFAAILTDSAHQSGTDRLNEAAGKLGLAEDEIIINVQADEPFIEPEIVDTLKTLVAAHRDDPTVMMCSLYKPIDNEAAKNPNLVKVVTDEDDFALYFSRSPIPFDREGVYERFKGHIGLYGYTKQMLAQFCQLNEAHLEHIEKLEQLRALSFGYRIAMAWVESRSIGIDTPEDLELAKSRSPV